MVALKRAGGFFCLCKEINSLTAESVQGASLPLEGIDNIHGGDSLPLGVFSVGDSIPDDVLQENLEDTAGLLVDEARDTLDTSTTSQTPDGGLGDALDVIPEHLPVPLGASLAKSLSSFASSGHVDRSVRLNGLLQSHKIYIGAELSIHWSIPASPMGILPAQQCTDG